MSAFGAKMKSTANPGKRFQKHNFAIHKSLEKINPKDKPEKSG